MAKRYRVSGPLTAYDTKPGGLTPPLDPNDPLVQVNIYAGIIYDPDPDTPDVMTCPDCPKKTAPKLEREHVDAHYQEAHGGLVVPAFNPDSEEE